MSTIDHIAKSLVDAGVELELARRKSCSQVVRIVAAMEHLKQAYDLLAVTTPWDEALLEALAVSEAPTIPEEVPRDLGDDGGGGTAGDPDAGKGSSTCRHGSLPGSAAKK